MFIPEPILQCDLAILSYHLYHQSVIWPLDPWYDVMTRSMSDRRVICMQKVHDWCDSKTEAGIRGPSSAAFAQKSNKDLDPVITRYDQMNPRLPAFTGTGDGYITVKTPAYITDRIQTVEIAQYTTAPSITADPLLARVEIKAICDYPNGTDHLIAFEGGHGLTTLQSEPAWSMSGFVLMRRDPDNQGVHDIHIAFRGSRSGGSIARTVIQALKQYGNPDWVTDLANIKVENDWVSPVGRVGRGFAYAIQTCYGSLYHALKHLHKLYGKPRRITVTGHSLGAALAAQMSLAMTNGQFSAYLVRNMPDWPWHTLRYVGWAQPTCGSKDFARNWALWVDGCFFWVEGDSVVTIGEGSSKMVDMASQHGGLSVMLPKPQGAKENPHEIYLARSAVLTALNKAGKFVDSSLSGITPWAQYDTFVNLVEGKPKSFIHPNASAPNHITANNIRSVLNGYHFPHNSKEFLNILSQVVLDPDAYKKAKILQKKSTRQDKSDRALRAARKLTNVGWGGGNVNMSMAQLKTDVLDTLVAEINMAAEIQGSDTAKYLGRVLAMNAFSRSNLSWAELKSRPAILACLNG